MPLLYSTRDAARELGMSMTELEKWLSNGRLKYALPPGQRKRRIYHNDLTAFAEWYRGEYLTSCRSPSEVSGGGAISTSKVLEFKNRSTAATAVPNAEKSILRKKRSAPKPSIVPILNPRPKKPG